MKAPLLLLTGSLLPCLAVDYPTKEEILAQQLPLTKKLHALVLDSSKEQPVGVAYQETVPRAGDAELKFVPIPAGRFSMGSPPSEEGRKADEGPQTEVAISAFWMSEIEIPWELFRPFYENDTDGSKSRNKDGTINYDGDRYSTDPVDPKEKLVDAVSQPTTQVMVALMFGGDQFPNRPEYPAMDMTHMAATKFCQWLTAQTGHFYRLPTEAEWEYACRAGSKTAYFFGDDPASLRDYAWFDGNTFDENAMRGSYRPVRQKKPNPWGLYDMHGNVAEWVLDGYHADRLQQWDDGVEDPFVLPEKRYPRVIRGGSWKDSAAALRSAARAHSKPNWKMMDPQIPKSVWYHTAAQHVGFRVVRPVEVPSLEEMHQAWNNDFWSSEFNAEDM
ncbi:MAG: formylglycine-generating enzyme family protein [Verrucomicrobiota bacterium JB023]|nr:formylglycine-generating enzyme family protein [Verrucomicrobiota bacterium JB023]